MTLFSIGYFKIYRILHFNIDKFIKFQLETKWNLKNNNQFQYISLWLISFNLLEYKFEIFYFMNLGSKRSLYKLSEVTTFSINWTYINSLCVADSLAGSTRSSSISEYIPPTNSSDLPPPYTAAIVPSRTTNSLTISNATNNLLVPGIGTNNRYFTTNTNQRVITPDSCISNNSSDLYINSNNSDSNYNIGRSFTLTRNNRNVSGGNCRYVLLNHWYQSLWLLTNLLLLPSTYVDSVVGFYTTFKFIHTVHCN